MTKLTLLLLFTTTACAQSSSKDRCERNCTHYKCVEEIPIVFGKMRTMQCNKTEKNIDTDCIKKCKEKKNV